VLLAKELSVLLLPLVTTITMLIDTSLSTNTTGSSVGLFTRTWLCPKGRTGRYFTKNVKKERGELRSRIDAMKETPCRFFALGFCKRGSSCWYSHGDKKQEMLPPNGRYELVVYFKGFPESTKQWWIQREASLYGNVVRVHLLNSTNGLISGFVHVTSRNGADMVAQHLPSLHAGVQARVEHGWMYARGERVKVSVDAIPYVCHAASSSAPERPVVDEEGFVEVKSKTKKPKPVPVTPVEVKAVKSKEKKVEEKVKPKEKVEEKVEEMLESIVPLSISSPVPHVFYRAGLAVYGTKYDGCVSTASWVRPAYPDRVEIDIDYPRMGVEVQAQSIESKPKSESPICIMTTLDVPVKPGKKKLEARPLPSNRFQPLSDLEEQMQQEEVLLQTEAELEMLDEIEADQKVLSLDLELEKEEDFDIEPELMEIHLAAPLSSGNDVDDWESLVVGMETVV
jgi:hypothetical protein